MLISKMELHQITQKTSRNNETNQKDDNLSDIRSRAQNLVDEASRAISDAKIKEKGSNNMGFGSQSISLRCLSKPSFLVIIDKMEALWH